MEKLVVIIDEMPEYGLRLALYLNGSRTFPYRAVVFSNAKEAERCIKSDGVYAVLATEHLEKDVLEVVAGTGPKLFWLSETEEFRRPSVIYRYGPAKRIKRLLVEDGREKKKIPVLGFLAPSGGCEAELLSRKIAEGLGQREKVLYCSMFPFGIYGRNGADGLSEALYFARQTEEDRISLQTILQHGEFMDSIGPVRWYTDLDGITKEDMEILFRQEAGAMEYSAILLAVGQFDRVGKNVLRCCDKILVPVWETECGKKIQEEFRRQLRESGEAKIYSGLVEFGVKDPLAERMEEAVKEAVRKGGEILAGYRRGDSETGVGTVGFIGGFNG